MSNDEFMQLMKECGVPKENIITVTRCVDCSDARKIQEEIQMSETTNTCRFCGNGDPIESTESDEIFYLDPNDGYCRGIRHDYHANVQVDINLTKYADARPGEDANATFKFNYCPECGRKLE